METEAKMPSYQCLLASPSLDTGAWWAWALFGGGTAILASKNREAALTFPALPLRSLPWKSATFPQIAPGGLTPFALAPWGHEYGRLSRTQMAEDAAGWPCPGQWGDRDARERV